MKTSLCCALVVLAAGAASAQNRPVTAEVANVYPAAEALYIKLHQAPELSLHENQTAATLASELKPLGYEVTTSVGGTGVVAVLKNGVGPIVMLRTELDALPVTEATALPFASKVRVKDESGAEVGVMHACGHDAHMAAWVATARIMANTRAQWHGTLVLIGQPAEEIGSGAKAMLDDGLFTKFPKPDYAIAVHDDARLPAGIIAYHAGPTMSNSDRITIKLYGRGGHGARPETTIDPVVIAARTVLSLQTIVAREISPFDPAVVTVGMIHGGTRYNVIPDDVELQLTARSFTPEVHAHLYEAIQRIAKAEATAARAPREPDFTRVVAGRAMVNDPALTERVKDALVRELGSERVQPGTPEMVSEDFSEFQLSGVPILMLRIGAVEEKKFAAAMKSGAILPSLHNSGFAPDREPTIKAAIAAEVVTLRNLLSTVTPASSDHSSGKPLTKVRPNTR